MQSPLPFRRKPLALLAGLLLPALAAAAQSGEEQFFGELPMVLTASRLAQPASQAPAPLTVIDREMIEASGFTEIHDLLRLVPGFLVADTPEGTPAVVNHGMGDARGRRLQVLVDGRSVYSPFQGTVAWQDLPIRVDDIERIEVVRGPNPASYGANAFQGVVNIITRSPVTEQGNSVVLRGGNRDFYEGAVRINGGDRNFDWRITASRRRAENFRDEAVNHFEMQETIYRDVLNTQALWQLGNQDEVRLQFGLSQGKDLSGESSGTNAGNNPVRYRNNDSQYLHAAWRHTYSPTSELTLQFYHYENRYRDDFIVQRTDFAPVPVDHNYDTVRDDLELQWVFQPAEGWQGMLGAGIRRDQIESTRYFADQGDVGGQQWQVFGNVSWEATEALRLNAGGMLERHYNTDVLFSPRLAANYSLSRHHVLRASTGRGYRAPTAWEATPSEEVWYNGQIVRLGYRTVNDLDPERVSFRELGYLGQLPELGLSIDARLFWEHYSKYMDSESCRYKEGVSNPCHFPAPPAYVSPGLSTYAYYFVNSGEIDTRGAELSLAWQHPRWGRVIFSHSLVNINTNSGIDDRDLNNSAPSNATSLLAIHPFGHGITGSIGLYRTSDMYWLNEGDEVPAQTRIDLKLAKRFGHAASDNELALTVQNLEGSYPEFHEGKYTGERRIFASLRVGF